MTDPDSVDPVDCINARMAGEPSECGEPESDHCESCRFCKHACTCGKLTALDEAMLALALDAYAQHAGGADWKAFCDRVPQHVADNAYECTLAAATPLLGEIRRLTAEVENLKHSKETP